MTRPCKIHALVLALLGLGCDGAESGRVARDRQPPPPLPATPEQPQQVAGEQEEEPISVTLPAGSAKGRKGRASPQTASSGAPSGGVGTSLVDCRSRCEGVQQSEDDLATCRLLCDAHYKQAARVAESQPINTFFSCYDQCEDPACAKGCAKLGPACAKTCLRELAGCLEPCVGSADESQCAERCETRARSCQFAACE